MRLRLDVPRPVPRQRGSRRRTAARSRRRAGLSDLERQQVVLAVQASSHTDVTTAEEALARVDQNEINQVEVWDATGAAVVHRLRVWRRGQLLRPHLRSAATPTRPPRSAIPRCVSAPRCSDPRGVPARPTPSARTELAATESPSETGRGLCVDAAADDHPAEGTSCSAGEDPACPLGSGLVCAGLTREEEGLCLPAWMRRRIEVAPQLPIDPTAPTPSMIVMSGLATVDMDVAVELTLSHADAASFRITLEQSCDAQRSSCSTDRARAPIWSSSSRCWASRATSRSMVPGR